MITTHDECDTTQHFASIVLDCSPGLMLHPDDQTGHDMCLVCRCGGRSIHVQGCLADAWSPPPQRVRAIDLTAGQLWHWVTVTDHTGRKIHGVLNRIELSADPRNRVVLRVSTREPTESGGTYWLTPNERYVNRDAMVVVGELLPESERWVQCS